MKKFIFGFITAICLFTLYSYTLQGTTGNRTPEVHVYKIQGKKFVVATGYHSIAICPY